MSDLEEKAQEGAAKKHPYNLREKKEKKAAYRSLIRPELADELYDRILNIIVVQKKYRDPNYSAKDLAKELKVTIPTIKKDLEALKTMSEEDFTFATRQTSQEILDKKDTILKMLDDENYYNQNGDLNISKIMKDLNTSRATIMSVLNGE